MKQETLNKKVLKYLIERRRSYKYCTLGFIKSEELRAASIDNFELAEAIKQALEQIRMENEN